MCDKYPVIRVISKQHLYQYTAQLDIFDLLGIQMLHGWVANHLDLYEAPLVTLTYNQMQLEQCKQLTARIKSPQQFDGAEHDFGLGTMHTTTMIF